MTKQTDPEQIRTTAEGVLTTDVQSDEVVVFTDENRDYRHAYMQVRYDDFVQIERWGWCFSPRERL